MDRWDRMKTYGGFLYISTVVLAILSTGFLVYNMLAIRIFAHEVFFERQTLSGAEISIAVGFGLILLFDVFSLLSVLSTTRRPQNAISGSKVVLIFGAFCLLLLLADKVMIDEIGREYLVGWEVLGEWIMLYGFLTTQLVYNLVVLLALFRVRPVPYSEENRQSPESNKSTQ